MRRLVGTTTARAKPRRRRQLLQKARANGGPAIVPVPFYCRGAQAMNRNLINTRLLSPLPLIVLTGLGLSVANAQTSPQSQIVRPATTSSTTTTSGSGQYYFEFRSRQAWDYG